MGDVSFRRLRTCRRNAYRRYVPTTVVSRCSKVKPRGHSMISSARASSCAGTSMPSALAVFRLITSSYFVGC
jgi:hypothetical protein